MLGAIRQAQISIDFEQYIFTNDVIGNIFLKEIEKKAEQGVKVRLLFDMVGSLSFYLSGVPATLQQKGVEIVFFNPISLWRLGNITSHFFRDHRKLLIVDQHIGLIGGVGIEDRMESWRDTMVEIEGDFVYNMTYTFDLVWKRVVTGRYRRFKRSPIYHKDYELILNSPRFRQRFLYYTFVGQIRNAKDSIYLATPYFIPDRRFLRALRVAAHRGVAIHLLLPKVSDQYFVDFAQSWYITRALKSKIRVHTYTPSFYHVKMAVIDDQWATVGSFNLDNLSFLFNHEVNIASSNSTFIDSIRHHFEKDILNSTEIDYDVWQKRSLIRKIIEVLTWPFHKVL